VITSLKRPRASMVSLGKWLAWAHLHQAAMLAKTTVYAPKQGLLDDYLCKQLRNPAYAINSA